MSNKAIVSPEKLMILYDNEMEEISESFAAVYWRDGNATIAGNLKSSDPAQLLKTLLAISALQEAIVKCLIKKQSASG
ncbi:MAG: hypothetical protein NTU41_00515 [Chloroflexi bacterium]|nr:hypothetical protein [Chloroflexota bacterium]